MKIIDLLNKAVLNHYYYLESNRINNDEIVVYYSGEYNIIKIESGKSVFKNIIINKLQNMTNEIDIKKLSFKEIELKNTDIIEVALTIYGDDVILIINDIKFMKILIFENQLKYEKIVLSLLKYGRLEEQINNYHNKLIKIKKV